MKRKKDERDERGGKDAQTKSTVRRWHIQGWTHHIITAQTYKPIPQPHNHRQIDTHMHARTSHFISVLHCILDILSSPSPSSLGA